MDGLNFPSSIRPIWLLLPLFRYPCPVLLSPAIPILVRCSPFLVSLFASFGLLVISRSDSLLEIVTGTEVQRRMGECAGFSSGHKLYVRCTSDRLR